MGMKPPKGQAKGVEGACSRPKATGPYEKIGNASTAQKQKGMSQNIGGSKMPAPKGE